MSTLPVRHPIQIDRAHVVPQIALAHSAVYVRPNLEYPTAVTKTLGNLDIDEGPRRGCHARGGHDAAAAEGNSGAAIATTLGLSEGTVRNYLSEAIAKVGASNRIEAARTARQNGWLYMGGAVTSAAAREVVSAIIPLVPK